MAISFSELWRNPRYTHYHSEIKGLRDGNLLLRYIKTCGSSRSYIRRHLFYRGILIFQAARFGQHVMQYRMTTTWLSSTFGVLKQRSELQLANKVLEHLIILFLIKHEIVTDLAVKLEP